MEQVIICTRCKESVDQQPFSVSDMKKFIKSEDELYAEKIDPREWNQVSDPVCWHCLCDTEYDELVYISGGYIVPFTPTPCYPYITWHRGSTFTIDGYSACTICGESRKDYALLDRAGQSVTKDKVWHHEVYLVCSQCAPKDHHIVRRGDIRYSLGPVSGARSTTPLGTWLSTYCADCELTPPDEEPAESDDE